MTTSSPADRLHRARISLEGLSVGDALGQRFFVSGTMVEQLIAERALPRAPWAYTDDTQMALSICSVLAEHGHVDQDALAQSFAEQYHAARSYGPATERLLAKIREGGPWRELSHAQFGGQGSMGNGGAMRAAPLGAYFADDLDLVRQQATLSCEVTHTHPEAIAGTIAVAIAAALAWRAAQTGRWPEPAELLDAVSEHTPDGEVRRVLRRAQALPPDAYVGHAVTSLGNGSLVSAPDTVPFAVWCAAQRLDNYEEAIWLTLSGQGDVDTTCAIVGGIVALHAGLDSIPAEWRQAREPLPALPLGAVRG